MDKKFSFLWLLLITATVGFWCSFVFADTGATSSPGWAQTWLIPYVGVISASLALLQSLVARGQTLTTGFWHTTQGHVLLTAFGALIGGGLSFIANGNFTPQAVWTTLASAITAFGGAWKTAGKPAPSGTTVATGPGPTITKAGALIPFVFTLAASMLVACAHTTPSEKAFGNAFATCMEGKGLVVGAGVANEVWTDLTTGSSATTIESQLEVLAMRAGVDAVACAANAFLAPAVISDGGTKLFADSPKNPAGVAAAQSFLAKHGQHA